jgi:hypothetical protein
METYIIIFWPNTEIGCNFSSHLFCDIHPSKIAVAAA